MRKKIFFFLLIFTGTTYGTLASPSEYTFDLNKPPVYAKEWFDIVKKDIKASEAGTIQANKKEINERATRFMKNLTPSGETTCEKWAAYKYAEQQFILTRFPNFDFLNKFRNTAKDAEEVQYVFWPWRIDGITKDPAMMVTGWALYPPSVPSDSKPEDVRKLHHYIVRLAVQMRLKMANSYDSEYAKNFAQGDTFEEGNKLYIVGPKPERKLTILSKSTQNETIYRIARRDNMWKEMMINVHMDIFNALRTMDSALCSLFRTHTPGEKSFIKEMLIEAGFKTPEQRKAYWQFCRTLGANWANWTPADEQRLVTD